MFVVCPSPARRSAYWAGGFYLDMYWLTTADQIKAKSELAKPRGGVGQSKEQTAQEARQANAKREQV